MSAIDQILKDGQSNHDILQVPPQASEEVIKKQYKKLALLCHPDRNTHPNAKEAFQKLTKAYDALLNGDIQTDNINLQNIFQEFMSSNVMQIVDLLHAQNPSLDKAAIERLLLNLRNVILKGKVKWELIRPEMKELNRLRGLKISIFNIPGRLQFSLEVTRQILVIMKKVADDGKYLDVIIGAVDGFNQKVTYFGSWF